MEKRETQVAIIIWQPGRPLEFIEHGLQMSEGDAFSLKAQLQDVIDTFRGSLESETNYELRNQR